MEMTNGMTRIANIPVMPKPGLLYIDKKLHRTAAPDFRIELRKALTSDAGR